MDVNRETAMRLWNKNYGKKIRIKDFAGREMLKAAYDDRNSEYGWNLDHIFPVSKGGKTADYNLICCNIKTNDEKADKFPVFNANDKKFQITKHENHYEIETCSYTKDSDSGYIVPNVNLFDCAEGIEAFIKCCDETNEIKYVDCITINLQGASEEIVDFIRRHIFSEDYFYLNWISNNCLSIKIVYFDKKLIQDIRNELDNCILLNTYILDYFLPKSYLRTYEIIFEGYAFNNLKELYRAFPDIICIPMNSGNYYSSNRYDNCIYIDEFVADSLKIDISSLQSKYIKGNKKAYKYDYVFTKLSKNLKKEVNRK